MQRETSGSDFLEYGSVYQQPLEPEHTNLIHQTIRSNTKRYVSQFLHFNCDTYIQVKSGIGVLLVSHTANTEDVQEFGMNRLIHILPNVYYTFVSTTPELLVNLYANSSYSLNVTAFPAPYEFLAVLPRIQINKILGYYYRMRTPNYLFKGERHEFFELTYVDTGSIYSEVEGVRYRINEKELMIYGPNQFHTQYTDETQSASYVTILFDMKNLTPAVQGKWYEVLINRVFLYDKRINTLLKTFVRESTTGVPYMNSLMLCLLTETVIRLLQGEYVVPPSQPSNSAHQSYQDELFDLINTFIEEKIYEPLTIPEICQKFSLSRSALQLLFKNSVNQSPKKYINDMKLEKSCQMLRKNKYTISEISLRLGYSSIHYFSKAFNLKYHLSPSEFAKRG